MLAITLLSAGCSTVGTSDVDPAADDYRLRHPILISQEPESFTVPVGMKGPAVSAAIEARVREYVAEYRDDGTGAITIQVPTGSANEIAASKTGHALHYALVRAGVPHGNIVVAPYQVGDHSRAAPLRLSYLRVKAVVPTCGIWPETGPNSFENVQYHNFGCANQQNLAAMVGDPADLIRPRTMTPAHGGRRANTIRIYVETGNIGWDPEPARGLISEDFGDN